MQLMDHAPSPQMIYDYRMRMGLSRGCWRLLVHRAKLGDVGKW